MSKENDKSKTSKTARVMSLLSKKQEQPAPQEEDTAAAAPAAESAASSETPPVQSAAAPLSPILSLAPDAAVSVQIKNALEDALEDELSEGQPPVEEVSPPPEAPSAKPEAAPVPESSEEAVSFLPEEPEVQADLAASASPEISDLTEESAVPEESAPPEEFAPPEPVVDSIPVPVQPVQPFAGLLEPSSPGYINVMQVLVEEKAPKYMKMFGICTCSKCQEDVKALALNHLPPKYVVMSGGERIPKLTFYEGQYSSDITAQLLKACTVVMQTPHHDR